MKVQAKQFVLQKFNFPQVNWRVNWDQTPTNVNHSRKPATDVSDR